MPTNFESPKQYFSAIKVKVPYLLKKYSENNLENSFFPNRFSNTSFHMQIYIVSRIMIKIIPKYKRFLFKFFIFSEEG